MSNKCGCHDLAFFVHENGVKIGRGSFSNVYKVVITSNEKNSKDTTIIAVKRILDTDEILLSEAITELDLMSRFSHPHIVSSLGVDIDNEILIGMNLAENDLLIHITSNNIDKVTINRYLYQLAEGVDFLHKNMITHSDLKPENILVYKYPYEHVKIADLGSSLYNITQDFDYRKVTTIKYRSPEVLIGDKFSNKIDIWALGLIFCFIILRKELFEIFPETEHEALEHIIGQIGNISSNQQKMYMKKFNVTPKNEYLSKLPMYHFWYIDLMLDREPSKRPTTEDILENQLFAIQKRYGHIESSIITLPLHIYPVEKLLFDSDYLFEFDEDTLRLASNILGRYYREQYKKIFSLSLEDSSDPVSVLKSVEIEDEKISEIKGNLIEMFENEKESYARTAIILSGRILSKGYTYEDDSKLLNYQKRVIKKLKYQLFNPRIFDKEF